MCVSLLVKSNEGMILNSIVDVCDLAFIKLHYLFYYFKVLLLFYFAYLFIVKCVCSGEYIEDLYWEID